MLDPTSSLSQAKARMLAEACSMAGISAAVFGWVQSEVSQLDFG